MAVQTTLRVSHRRVRGSSGLEDLPRNLPSSHAVISVPRDVRQRQSVCLRLRDKKAKKMRKDSETDFATRCQILEQRLNLNRSWYKDHSHAYNTSFYFESSTKYLSSPQDWNCFCTTEPMFWVGTGGRSNMILEPFGPNGMLYLGEEHSAVYQR